MRRATAQALPSRYRVVLATRDEDMRRQAQECLLPAYEISVLKSTPELSETLTTAGCEALFLDLDSQFSAPEDALEILTELRSSHPDLVLFVFTSSRNRELRLKLVATGIDEYFAVPFQFEEVRLILDRTLEKRAAALEYGEDLQIQSFEELIGGSEAMRRVYEAIRRVADSNTTVLLRGESGAGKELVARAIVSHGPRSEKPFISINCAALPEHLIETELFGHEKGAFTDAKEARAGYIELAHGGTLFLDEIATLGLALQSKLLRVLEERAVARIGGKTAKKIDFRLIAATNEDLEKMVQTGRFREDLYYRINVIPIVVPPLRERDGDLPILVDHFLRQFCRSNHLPVKRIHPEVLAVMEDYPWPGNIRELQNVIQRLVLMSDGPVIELKHLPQQLLVASSASQEAILIPEGGVDFDAEMDRLELAYLSAALNRTGGRKSAAAALLRIDTQRMKYLCRKRGL